MSTHEKRYDLILVGTGPSSSFFLRKYIERFGTGKQVLILERGDFRSHAEMLDKHDWTDRPTEPLYVSNPPGGHHWQVRPSFGGNSNYWLGDTPRLVPADFETATRFGQGADWPIGYDDIEADYSEVEDVMQIAGDDEIARMSWRSRPFPQRFHSLSLPDRILKKAYPDTFFAVPTARAREATEFRNSCCNTNSCQFCPTDAKFRVMNELAYLYELDNLQVELLARVRSLDTEGGVVTGVNYEKDGAARTARGELVVLGANPIFNSEIMLRSGDTSPMLGRGISTHPWYLVTCLLDGVEGFQGGTLDTGACYELYTDEIRKRHAGCVLVTINKPFLRPEYGRWREVLQLQAAFEDVPKNENFVDIDPATDLVRIHYGTHSDHMLRGRDALPGHLERVLSVLPVEDIDISHDRSSGGHIMCTHRMGTDPATSVTDPGLVHHRFRNVVMLGGGSFVTPGAANPTLTMTALANRAVRLL